MRIISMVAAALVIAAPAWVQVVVAQTGQVAPGTAPPVAAVSTFIVATNARASLIGRVDVFCNEKSWRGTPCAGTSEPPFVKSTKNDKERTSGFWSEFTCGSELPKRTVVG